MDRARGIRVERYVRRCGSVLAIASLTQIWSVQSKYGRKK
jgi:hypothetical protein